MQAFLAQVWAFEQAHWQGQLALALTQLPSIIVALTAYPTAQGWAKKVLTFLNIFSFLVHKDSPGTLKLPGVQSQPPPVIGQPVATVPPTLAPAPKGFANPDLLLIMGLVAALSGCAAIQWGSPVFSAGPSVAVTEIPIGSPGTPVQVAEGAGAMASLGLGQFALLGKSWDALNLSAAVLGAPGPGQNPSGALQLVPMVGTFNNLIALGPVFTPWAANGAGFIQGGHPGTSLAFVLNLPISVGPFAPPIGIPSEGAKALPRGATWYLP